MSDSCFCTNCQKEFRKYYLEKTGKTIEEVTQAVRKDEEVRKVFNSWRVELITSVVKEVRRRVDLECPHVKISAAVFNTYPACINSVAQDWVDWIRKGYLDFVCPMNYTNDPLVFEEMYKRQMKYINDPAFPFFPGIGYNATGSTHKPANSIVQIEMARALGARGFCIFNLTPVTAQSAMPLFSIGPTRTKSTFPEVKRATAQSPKQ